MNQIIAKYMSRIFIQHKVISFEVKIFNSRVSLQSVGEEFSIDISGRKAPQKLYRLLTDIESLIFFYLGSFPLMSSLKINGMDEDISNRVGKIRINMDMAKRRKTNEKNIIK